MLKRAVEVVAVSTVVLALAVAIAAPVPAVDRSAVKLETLGNGLRVVVKETPAGHLASVALYIRAGSRTEADFPAGISRFVQALLFEGAEGSETRETTALLAARGLETASAVSKDFTFVRVDGSGDDIEAAVEGLAKCAFRRELTTTETERVRRQLLREGGLEGRDLLSALQEMEDVLWKEAFPHHPYGREQQGTPGSLDAITGALLDKYTRTFYVPNNMSLVVAGPVTATAVVGLAEKHFGGRERGTAAFEPPAPEEPQDTLRKRTLFLPPPAAQAVLKIGFHAPGMTDRARVCATDIIYTILGQGPRARLPSVLVQQEQVASAVDVEFVTRRDTGLLTITCVYESDSELQLRQRIQSELGRLQAEPLGAEELADAKRLLARSYALSNESPADQTGSLGFYEGIDTWEFAADYLELVNAVTAEQVQQVAREVLRMDAATLVIGALEGPGPAREA